MAESVVVNSCACGNAISANLADTRRKQTNRK